MVNVIEEVLRQLPDPAFLKDRRGVYLYCNDAYAEFVGKSQSSIVGSATTDLFPDRTAQQILRKEKSVYSTRKAVRYPVRSRMRNQGSIWMDVHLSPIEEESGEVVVLGILRDITAMKEAWEEIEFRENFETTVLSIATDFVNKTAREIELGFSGVLQIVGRLVEAERAYLLVYDRNEKRIDCVAAWAIEGLDTFEEKMSLNPSTVSISWRALVSNFEAYEVPDIEATGPEFDSERDFFRSINARALLAFPVHTQYETLGTILFTQRHVSEGGASERYQLVHMVALLVANALVRAEIEKLLTEYSGNLEKRVRERTQDLDMAYETLKQTQTQLLQAGKMASIGQLAAGVAHEINNPVGFVKSNLFSLQRYTLTIERFIDEIVDTTGELREKYDIDELMKDIRELVSDSIEGTRRVETIVANLRTFSRMDRGDRTLSNINEMIRTTLKVIWNEVKYKATVEQDFGDLPEIYCHSDRLNQVFVNILVNAVQSIEEQGTITIHTGLDEGNVMIRIEDTGSGMSPEVRDRVFEPFFTTKDVGQGTGLGLSIVYDIITAHGGTISVDSEEGVGSSFTISLPAQTHLS